MRRILAGLIFAAGLLALPFPAAAGNIWDIWFPVDGTNALDTNHVDQTYNIGPSYGQITLNGSTFNNVLNYGYALSTWGVTGDIEISDSASVIHDVIEFNPSNHVWFFSLDGTSNAANWTSAGGSATPQPSGTPVQVMVSGATWTVYTPTAGQPGFMSNGDTAVYHFETLGQQPTVPEPATWALFGGGILACFARRRLAR
jgi:hypothetical protein